MTSAMSHSAAEIILAYGFAVALFVSLPSSLF